MPPLIDSFIIEDLDSFLYFSRSFSGSHQFLFMLFLFSNTLLARIALLKGNSIISRLFEFYVFILILILLYIIKS